jgi:HSP20 family molecular chaperone IbpA
MSEIDEFFRRVERRFRELEDTMRQMIESALNEIRLERLEKPYFAESIEPLYNMRDLGDRLVIHIDLPYCSEGNIDVWFEDNKMHIRAALKCKLNISEWSERYRGVEVKEYNLVLPLPFKPQPDKVRSRVKRGVLEIIIYK